MNQQKSTSFMQYVLCSVCRISHNSGSKHVYSKQHQNNVKNILKKSLSKVSEGKKCMTSPEIHCKEWEKDTKFWCYFCSSEYPKHHINNNLMVACLGLIHHHANHDHYNAVKQFLKENRASKENADKYIIKKSDLLSFMDRLQSSEASYLKKVEVIYQKHVSQIETVEHQRKYLLDSVACERSNEEYTLANGISPTNGLYPLNKNSDCISRKVTTKHNTCKIPPWLLPSTAVSCKVPASEIKPVNQTIIGPSIDDLMNHFKKQEKKGLNPKRVGADFNHKAVTSPSWLPSFKGVWSRRRHKPSLEQFKKRKQPWQNHLFQKYGNAKRLKKN